MQERALELEPDSPIAHYTRARMLRELRRDEEAYISLCEAIGRDPRLAQAYNERGNIRREQGDLGAAIVDYDRALAVRPDYADAHYHRALVLQDSRQLTAALLAYDRAISLDPRMVEAHNNRGRVLRMLNRPDQALAAYDRALALNPELADVHNNRGVVLKVLRRFEEALASYARAIELRPDHRDAHWNVALLLLLTGHFAEGWPLYEWRQAFAPRRFPQPAWLGAVSVAGKRILVHAEQGLGDFIQFCRYVPLLTHAGAEVVLEVPAALKRLASTLRGVSRLVESQEAFPECDLHCAMLSLPLAFRTTVATIPSEVPYLHASPSACVAANRRLGERRRLRVGLAWAGGIDHEDDRNRSLALESVVPLLAIEAEFHALQKEYRSEDRAVLERDGRLLDHHAELSDFADTAALVAAMDLVIAVDTAVAHLAGALGKPVWILITYSPDFRWLLDRSDSPWYPTATLFRQSAPGVWTDVLARVAGRLREEVRHA